MNIAIWQLTNQSEVLLLQDNRLVFADTITEENKLQGCYTRLKGFKIDELYVMILPTVSDTEIPGTYTMRKFKIGSKIVKYSLVSEEDLDKIKELCKYLNINKAKVYDTFSVYPLISCSAPTIICGENINESYSYAYVDLEGIQDFRIAKMHSPDIIASMREMYNNPYTTTFYSRSLLDGVAKKIDNFNCLEYNEKIMTMIAPALSLITQNAPVVLTNVKYDAGDDDLDINIPQDITDDFIEGIELERNEKKPIKPMIEEKEEIELKDGKDEKRGHKAGIIALDIIGGALAMVLGFSIMATKEMPKDIQYLADKQQQVQSLVEPNKDTVNYYNQYLKGLESGKNIDFELTTAISKVKVDGVLAEVRLNQDKVGVMVYLKNPKDIDGLKDQYGKVFDVTKVNNEGVVSAGSTSLNKFTINGTIKS